MEATLDFTLEQLRDVSISDFLRMVLEKNSRLQVFMPDGKSVIVKPEPKLIPLPELNGNVPNGWKEAIYVS